MERLPSETESKIGTLFATLVGFALIDGFTALEQNAIGNWFMLVGQILETNAAFLQQFNQQRQVHQSKIKSDNDAFEMEKLKKWLISCKESMKNLQKKIRTRQIIYLF